MNPTPPPQSERNRLLAEVEAAFGDVRLGRGTSLHQARAMDDYESPQKVAAVRSMDTEERWQDIPDDKIEYFDNILAFMDAEGFRFHLPRFMVWSLMHMADSGSFAVDAPIYACCLPRGNNDKKGLNTHALAQYALLSEQQCAVIAGFLRFVIRFGEAFADANAAAAALNRYWARYG